MLTIAIDQAEIELAIRKHVATLITVADGANIGVVLSTSRQPTAYSAAITIGDVVPVKVEVAVEVVAPAVVTKRTAEVITKEPDPVAVEAEVAVDPVVAEPVVVEETVAEEVAVAADVAEEVAPRKSIFSAE